VPKLTAMDEHFVHQLPEPLPVAAIEHHHWRESYFFVTHGPDRHDDVVIVAMAHYPARGAMDALLMGRIGGERLFQYHARPYGDDPHTTSVGPVTVSVEEPLRRLRVSVEPTDGFAADLMFTARTQPYLMRRGRLSDADGLIWDQSQMFQSGQFSGTYTSGGQTHDVAGWLGQRDHSWGVRNHGRVPLWVWLAVQLPDGMFGLWNWELADGSLVFLDGCWAPADGSDPVPLVGFDHELTWTVDGRPAPWATNGEGITGLSGRVSLTTADGRTVTLDAEGEWCAPYVPFHGGGLNVMDVRADDGRTGTAIYEVTGRHHHRYFPDPPSVGSVTASAQ